MNRFQRFIQKFSGEKQVGKPAGYLPFSDDFNYFQQDGSEELLRSYKSWVYAAVTKRADTFSSMKLTLNKIVKKGKNQEVQPVTTHPILELLDKVNPYLSFTDLLKITQTYKDLAGNAYWWIVKEGNKITEIYPYIRPDRVSVIPSSTNFIDGYNYQAPNGDTVKFSPDEIIHFKTPNPMSPYTGVAPMEACFLAYNTYTKSSEYNNRFFNNNARADFLLAFPNGLTEVEQKQIRTQWETRHRGMGKEHKFAILSGDAKVMNVGMTAKDMEFIEQMKFTRDEILAIFKVPKALLDPQELNYASAQVAKAVFNEEVVMPLMRDFVCTLNEFLLPHYNDDSLFFDFEDISEQTPESKNAKYEVLARVGAIAPNEIRAMEGLPPFEGGNNIYISTMLSPIGEADMNQAKMLVGSIKKVELKKKYNTNIKSKSHTAELREKIVDSIKENMSQKNIDKKKQITPEQKSVREKFLEGIWYGKIAKTNTDEKKMQKIVNKIFVRQEENVLKSLSKKSFSFKFDIDKESEEFVKVILPFIEGVVTDYGADAMQMVDMNGFDLTTRARDWINDNVKNFSTEINGTTLDKIRKALSTALEEGEGIPEASKRIRMVFAEATSSRSRAIARTEISHASNFASVEAWKQSEVVEAKEWLTALDERTDEECADLNGKVISLDSSFPGTDDIFGNVEEPPLHVNCRCTLIPVIKSKNAVIRDIKRKEDEANKHIEESKKLLHETKDVVKGIKTILNDDETAKD